MTCGRTSAPRPCPDPPAYAEVPSSGAVFDEIQLLASLPLQDDGAGALEGDACLPACLPAWLGAAYRMLGAHRRPSGPKCTGRHIAADGTFVDSCYWQSWSV